MGRNRATRMVAGVLLVVLAVGAAACSSSSDTSSTTGTTGSPGTTASPGTTGTGSDPNLTDNFDTNTQRQLQTVGCYSGAIDGIFGPQSDAALVAFQQAKGLETDGELGPETETALTQAAGAGQKVCTSPPTTGATTTTAAPGARCTAASMAAAFPNTGPVTGYVCAGNYAAVLVGGSGYLVTRGPSGWTNPTPASQVCAGGPGGYPTVVITFLCSSTPSSSTTASTSASSTTSTSASTTTTTKS